MPAFTYKCPACGNALKFEPNSGNFACEFCGTTYDKAFLDKLDDKAYKQEEAAGRAQEQEKNQEQYLYSCPSCGAELTTSDTTAATMCYYCHNPVVIVGRLEDTFKPDAVLPFKYDKQGAKDRFFKWIRKKKYVPREFISEASVQRLSGIYYPYWLADYESSASFTGEGQIVTHATTAKYNITTTKFYSISRDADISFRNVQRSALQKADRKLSDGVHPYHLEEMVDFAPSYLSGFMAEKRDVAKEAVSASVEAELQGYAQPLITSGTPYTSVVGSTTMKLKGNRYRYALLPAFIMTYRGEKGVMYYYAMNGQTGEVCGVLPVDKKKLLFHGGILSALVCGVLLAVFYFFV
jgi:DNA-directed RNA polymerase subunit RPC12/RpoP